MQSNCAIVTKKLIDVMGLIDGPGHPFSNSFAQFSMVISRVNSCTFSNLLRKIHHTHSRICRYCNKTDTSQEFQKNIKSCIRCKSAYYCSKEYQTADWKTHKKNCRPATKAMNKAFDATQNAPLNFAKANYPATMERIVEVSDETGLNKSELLLELDFNSNDDKGIAPALQDPPK